MSFRIQQINNLIKETVSKLVHELIDAQKLGVVTITTVNTSKDFSVCKIWVSTFNEEKRDDLLKELNKNVYRIQKEMNHLLYLKKVPKIVFTIDETPTYADNIENILKKIKK